MDEYVPVEAYDVTLGSDYVTTGSDDPNRVSNATGTATARWTLDGGVVGQGWDLPYYDFVSGSLSSMNVYGTSHEEIAPKVTQYLNLHGGMYVNMIGCS